MTVLRARRGGTGSKYVTFGAGCGGAFRILLLGSGAGRAMLIVIWDETAQQACVLRRGGGRPSCLIHSVRPIAGRARGTLPAAWPQAARFSRSENAGGGSPGFSALADQHGGFDRPE
jgi:hypothetical protein